MYTVKKILKIEKVILWKDFPTQIFLLKIVQKPIELVSCVFSRGVFCICKHTYVIFNMDVQIFLSKISLPDEDYMVNVAPIL